jgi:hypothetical protein
MADAADLNSAARKGVRVRISAPAPISVGDGTALSRLARQIGPSWPFRRASSCHIVAGVLRPVRASAPAKPHVYRSTCTDRARRLPPGPHHARAYAFESRHGHHLGRADAGCRPARSPPVVDRHRAVGWSWVARVASRAAPRTDAAPIPSGSEAETVAACTVSKAHLVPSSRRVGGPGVPPEVCHRRNGWATWTVTAGGRCSCMTHLTVHRADALSHAEESLPTRFTRRGSGGSSRTLANGGT